MQSRPRNMQKMSIIISKTEIRRPFYLCSCRYLTAYRFGLPPRVYSNPQFLASFAQSFTDFAKTLNVNNHDDPDNITPEWNLWSEGHTEMLFNATNLTVSGVPVIQPFHTDPALLDRCAYVLFSLLHFSGELTERPVGCGIQSY